MACSICRVVHQRTLKPDKNGFAECSGEPGTQRTKELIGLPEYPRLRNSLRGNASPRVLLEVSLSANFTRRRSIHQPAVELYAAYMAMAPKGRAAHVPTATGNSSPFLRTSNGPSTSCRAEPVFTSTTQTVRPPPYASSTSPATNASLSVTNPNEPYDAVSFPFLPPSPRISTGPPQWNSPQHYANTPPSPPASSSHSNPQA